MAAVTAGDRREGGGTAGGNPAGGGPAEAQAVLERLARIERLDGDGAPPGALLGELRQLLREAEAWVRAEGGEAGGEAVARLRSALAHDMIDV